MRIIFFISFFIVSSFTFSNTRIEPVYMRQKTVWAQNLLEEMTLEQRIGQLIMVTTYPSQGESNEKQIRKWIEEDHVGGVLFLRSTPYELASRANAYQSYSNIPLFIALDAENGLSFRLDSVVQYPHAMSMGALSHDSLIYQMGREVGQQCRALGINLNFAPVADVNTNPQNPIINHRSFGENPRRVAQKAWQMARGMQDENVFVSAKHFPGHGDTAFDSHHTLPIIRRNYEQLSKTDFVPFEHAIQEGINGIMTAHISMPEIDKSGLPGTLSPQIMTSILRDSLLFDGLVFSDGMNMKGITLHYNEGEAAVMALKAGVDVIEFVLNPRIVIDAVKQAIDNGTLTMEQINEKCFKVLMAKKWLGLNDYKPVKLEELFETVNAKQYELTARLMHEQAITVLQNKKSILPLQRLDTLRIATVSIGGQRLSVFQETLSRYTEVDNFYVPQNASLDAIKQTIKKLSNYNLVIAGVHGTSIMARNNYSVKDFHKNTIELLAANHNLISVFFSNPYSINSYKRVEKSNAIVVTYGDNDLSQSYAAQLIFGAIGTNSSLPVSVNSMYKEGDGVQIKPSGRFKYTIPEELGFESSLLYRTVDSLANMGIEKKMFPGCQVLLAKKGSVFFHRAYGFHTYDSIRPLNTHDIYDWASLTKIVGPLPLLMKMTEDGIVELDAPFSIYWAQFKNTDKETVSLREMLTHQAGFRPWVPFYLQVTANGPRHRDTVVREHPGQNFNTRLSSSLYIRDDFKQIILDQIGTSDLLRRKRYAYSDLPFLLFPDFISQLKQRDYEQILEQDFLTRLGASTVKYKPYQYFESDRFVPTEVDYTFRRELLQGYVHDETAAMMGGVSGNAGLFGTTNDLAKIMQFYLQKGTFGDFVYLKPETLMEFTRVQYSSNDNRRALGFDKPYIDNSKNKMEDAYPAPAVSANSFGHSGFTGTFVWADPENELLFIFMSNRVYPTRDNTLITSESFRPRLQQSIYELQNTYRYTNF